MTARLGCICCPKKLPVARRPCSQVFGRLEHPHDLFGVKRHYIGALDGPNLIRIHKQYAIDDASINQFNAHDGAILLEFGEWPKTLDYSMRDFVSRHGVCLECSLTDQVNRRPAARAKPCRRGVRVERVVRPHDEHEQNAAPNATPMQPRYRGAWTAAVATHQAWGLRRGAKARITEARRSHRARPRELALANRV